jgi:hypothetical protein
MRIISIILILVFVASAQAGNSQYPPEVEEFIRGRNLCDHFRGEPYEGNSPEQIKRREFIFESLEIFCPGSDRRLAALKKRFKNDNEVMKLLNRYEKRINAP